MYLVVGAPPYNHENTLLHCNVLYREAASQNGLIKNQDGTLSLYVLNANGVKTPNQISKTCCERFKEISGEDYFFDIEKQTCNWSTGESSSILCESDIPLKVILNPKGNDGSLFFREADDTCSLLLEFDYLFKFDCNVLRDLVVMPPNTTNETINQIQSLQTQINEKIVTCSGITTQFNQKLKEYTSTPYSISCDDLVQVAYPITIYDTQIRSNPFLPNQRTSPILGSSILTPFGTTGFGSRSPFVPRVDAPIRPRITAPVKRNFCIKEPDGLLAWKAILDAVGPDKYDKFILGDATSYTCGNFETLRAQANGTYVYVCNVVFGTKSKLKVELDALSLKVDACNAEISALQTQLDSVQNSFNDSLDICKTPVGVFENLDVWVNLDVITSAGTLETVYSENIFNRIGEGKLYNYLKDNKGKNTGFYICGQPQSNETWATGCTPLKLTSQNNAVTLFGEQHVNLKNCDDVNDNMLAALFIESDFTDINTQLEALVKTLDINSFNSNWLRYSRELTMLSNPEVINKIANKKIKVSFTFSSSCSDVTILLDQITMNKICVDIDTRVTVIDKSPGFNLERVIDNKKSWVNNDTLIDREFLISNSQGGDINRRTDYESFDERLMINSKEIDLTIDIAKAIETDVWCYISDNPCLLTGTTALNPCLSCNTTTIDIDSLLTTEVSAITTIEGFEKTILSELIDAKNRKVIQSYPTLKALYERYLNSSAYCSTNSSAFNYYSMEQFVNLLGTYWVDLIEQVVPATTLWDSVKVYTNTVFDQQKFRYKPYTIFYGPNPFAGRVVSSPINGTSGVSQNVEVIVTTIVARRNASNSFLSRTLSNNFLSRNNSIPSSLANILGTTTNTGTGLVRANSEFIITGPNSFLPISTFNGDFISRNVPTTYSNVCISQFNYGSEFIGNITISTGSRVPSFLQPIDTPIIAFNPNINNLITE